MRRNSIKVARSVAELFGEAKENWKIVRERHGERRQDEKLNVFPQRFIERKFLVIMS